MSQKQIDQIVFDLGGVLIDWNPRYLYRKLFADPKEMEWFLTEVCHGHWNEQQDAGRSFEKAIQEVVAVHPRYEEMIRAYFHRWGEMISGPIQGTVEILESLHRKGEHRLFALTNWSAETFPYARKNFPFLGLFEGIVVSGVEKLIKPDPKFFGLLTERHGVVPERSLFIDDVQKNIDAASRLGFNSIRFTGPEDLRARLSEHGVKI